MSESRNLDNLFFGDGGRRQVKEVERGRWFWNCSYDGSMGFSSIPWWVGPILICKFSFRVGLSLIVFFHLL